MGGKRWSDAEKRELAKIAEGGKPLISQMHRLPGRTWEAAKTRASLEGLLLNECDPWPDEDRETLRQIYAGNESIKLGVRRLLPHRSYASAKSEAARLGIAGEISRAGRYGYSWVALAMESALANGARLTVKQLAARTGASIDTVHNKLSKYRGVKFRIGEWTRETLTGDWAARWEIGVGPDEPRPARKTATESCRDYRARQRMRAGPANPFHTLVAQVAS